MDDTELPSTPVPIGMLTADPLRLDGLKALLEADGAYQVVPLAASAGHESGAEPSARLIVIDVESVINLESLLRQVRRARPQVGVLVLGPPAGLEQIMDIIGFGAHGYLPYRASEKELRMALQVIQEGSIWAPRKVLALLLAKKGKEPAGECKLTRREEEVLRLLVQGRPNRQIAEALGLDETTVKAHLGRIMRKLGVRNRIALSMVAMARFHREAVDK